MMVMVMMMMMMMMMLMVLVMMMVVVVMMIATIRRRCPRGELNHGKLFPSYPGKEPQSSVQLGF